MFSPESNSNIVPEWDGGWEKFPASNASQGKELAMEGSSEAQGRESRLLSYSTDGSPMHLM